MATAVQGGPSVRDRSTDLLSCMQIARAEGPSRAAAHNLKPPSFAGGYLLRRLGHS